MFWGRPQSFLLTSSLPFFAVGALAAGAIRLEGLDLNSATYSRCWLISAGRSAGIPMRAQSELDRVSFAAGLQQHSTSGHSLLPT